MGLVAFGFIQGVCWGAYRLPQTIITESYPIAKRMAQAIW
jgi:hypothetical protein